MKESKFIPSKGTKKPIKQPTTPIEAPQLPDDLKVKLEALEASSLTCALLQKGMFHLRDCENVAKVLKFHVACYNAMLDEALAHPQAELDPELKEIIELRKKEKQDGKNQGQ